jgi:polyisoprenyl-phosphate glycosyltransferase
MRQAPRLKSDGLKADRMSPSASNVRSRPLPDRLSIVIPLYNEEAVLPLLQAGIEGLLPKIPCAVEVVLVDDGSRDSTFLQLSHWAGENPAIKVLALSRNFGHQSAATAGLDYASGEAVVLMDADLQDPPELILPMLEKYCEGYDVVYAQRIAREGEGFVKRVTAWAFYRLMRLLIHRDLPVDVGDYRLLSRPCLNALRQLRETHRFLRGMVVWVGFPQTAIQFRRPPRAAGHTKYPLRKMLSFASNAALSFSALPLKILFVAGFILAGAGFVYGIYATCRFLMGLYMVPGWTSLIVAQCMIGGSILMGLGMVGSYVARIFEEVKARPLYIIARSINIGAAQTEPQAVMAIPESTRFDEHPRNTRF